MINNKLEQVIKLLESEKAKDAQDLFRDIDPAETVEYLFVKGKLDQKFQNFGEAMNAFSRVVEIDPENVEAKNNIHFIQNILNFWNPEMFNP